MRIGDVLNCPCVFAASPADTEDGYPLMVFDCPCPTCGFPDAYVTFTAGAFVVAPCPNCDCERVEGQGGSPWQ